MDLMERVLGLRVPSWVKQETKRAGGGREEGKFKADGPRLGGTREEGVHPLERARERGWGGGSSGWAERQVGRLLENKHKCY